MGTDTDIIVPERADLVLYGGRIATLDASLGVVSALAIRSGWVVAAGSDADCLAQAGSVTVRVNLRGAFVMPGIHDSHCHPDSQAVRAARWADLSQGLRGTRDLLARIAAFACRAPRPAWFLGYRFDEGDIGAYPERTALDAAAANRPVFLLRRDAQVGFVNTAALASARASGALAEVPARCVDEATGRVHGRAVFAFTAHIAVADTIDDYLRGYPAVFAEMARLGISSVHNALTSALAVQAYRRLYADGALPVRVGMMLNGRDQALVDQTIEAGVHFGMGDAWLYTLGVEYGSDGSTSGRTAAYYAPYVEAGNAPTHVAPNRGEVNFSAAALRIQVARVMGAGLQVAITGNGDRGIDFALDAIAYGLARSPQAIAPRIEHCCCAPPKTQQRMARLGVIDASASAFLYSLGDTYLRNRPVSDWPWLWPHRDMLARGVLVCGHSDAPVCERNPFLGMAAMVTRRTASGAVVAAEQAISVEAAMRCYTVYPAIAERQHGVKGTLTVGFLADLIVLDQDLYRVEPERLHVTRVLATLVGGRATYRCPDAAWADALPERFSDRR